MNIVYKNIHDLKFADYNPRQLTDEQYNHLCESLTKFGIVDPIIINTSKGRENVIIGGHQRIKVALTLEIEQVPCIELSLPIEEEKELNVRLNKNTGEWDMDMLANLFDEDDLFDWGFTQGELGGIGQSFKEPIEQEFDETIETENKCPKCGYEW